MTISIARRRHEEALARLAASRKAEAVERAALAEAQLQTRPTQIPSAPEPKPGRPAALSPARAAVARHAARLAAAAANDNAALPSDEALAGPYGEMLLQLTEHKRQLKAIESTEKKIELKRQILGVYDEWVNGVIAAAKDVGKAVQDDVVMTVMVWRIDAGDFMGALEIAELALAHGLQLPGQFNRSVACLVAEEMATAALTAPADAPIPHGVLDLTAQLVDGRDMPDQVRAKMAKAQAEELVRLAENPPEGQDVAAWRPHHLNEAIALYRRALQLDAKVGVKKAIEILERALKKEAPANGAQ